MLQTLSHETIKTQAPGKFILSGEHAAVYGFPAIAICLQDITLTLELQPYKEEGNPPSWNQAWELFVGNEPLNINESTINKLTECLNLALLASPLQQNSDAFFPQTIKIHSEIPLGAGMGGSAALCIALQKMLNKLCFLNSSKEELIEKSNTLDNIFHGKSSGIDVATIVFGGIIENIKGKGIKKITNKKSFWVLLIDSLERTPTLDMVNLVTKKVAENPEYTNNLLQEIGKLSTLTKQCLEQGDLISLGTILNQNHTLLCELGVSTPKINAIIDKLKFQGALGAKLTGGGGGGLLFGIFEKNPMHLLSDLSHLGPIYSSIILGEE